ncbi:NitT/TauT family transport system substrate-binding protein [Paenibacillus mucilaginosus]|uniref:ABC transporter substrate-binding protein n=1 Tax=Paenibacillus mucilaginosus TaxID=61624 RepID=UPI003D1C4E9B
MIQDALRHRALCCVPLKAALAGLLAGVMTAVTGCGFSAFSPAAGGAAALSKGAPAAEVKVVLNWFAKHEHGGLYAAEKRGYYRDAGLRVTIEQGGPLISSIQLVASGRAEFGIAQADQLLLARDQGLPLVALAATFQTSPQALLFHKEADPAGFSGLNGRTVYIQQEQPYWAFLKKTYGLRDVREIAYTGQLAGFVHDRRAVSQGFVSGESFELKARGIEAGALLVADSGYRPYGGVLFTTERMLKGRPETVRAFIGSTVKGWDCYRAHPKETNAYLQERSPKLSAAELEFGEAVQRDYIFGGDAAMNGMGWMKAERWLELGGQLHGIGLLSELPEAADVFTTAYLPAAGTGS